MMFVVENGDVLLCFLSEPIGNLYESPLVKIWNSPRAIAKRSEMIQGRYLSSGCSQLWCDWRDGKNCATPSSESRKELLDVFKQVRDRVAVPQSELFPPALPGRLGAVRRLLEGRERRIVELEAQNAKNAARAERLAKEIKGKKAIIEHLRGHRQRRKLRLRRWLFG
jgi:hypothetical protein